MVERKLKACLQWPYSCIMCVLYTNSMCILVAIIYCHVLGYRCYSTAVKWLSRNYNIMLQCIDSWCAWVISRSASVYGGL